MKEYKDRSMAIVADKALPQAEGNAYFFPKENPPITIVAENLKEAEKLLAKSIK